MLTTGNLDQWAKDGKPVWVQFLDRVKTMDPVMHFFALTVQDALQLPGKSRAVWAAHRVNDYYSGGYRCSGRDSSFFLAHLYYLIFSVAKFIPCGGPLQGALVELIVQLRKLPETKCLIDGVRNCLPRGVQS